MGVAQASKGNATAAAEEARQMDAMLKDYEAQVKHKAPPELLVARQELDGHVLAAEGKTKQAMNAFGTAATAQRKLRYSEPPYYPRPVDAATGEAALKMGQLTEAENAFRRALSDLPGNVRSVDGLNETLRRENKQTGAAAAQYVNLCKISILGAGPAGSSAAIAARREGAQRPAHREIEIPAPQSLR